MSRHLKPERTFNAALEEEVFRVTYPSGLRAFLCRKPGFKKRYVCYSTFYGSVDSEFVVSSGRRIRVPDGIAHFLEHTLFETERGNVSDLFAQLGAYSNAATSFTTTTYLFATSDRFYQNLKLLLSFVENPVFDPQKVEKERGIIEQEIQGYRDSPHWVSYMGLLENLFASHPLRIDIAGTVDTIRRITSDDLHECYRAFYQPSNMILFAVGDIEPDALFEFVAESSSFASAPASNGNLVERVYPAEPAAVFRTETRRDMEVALPKLLLGFKETEVPDRGKPHMRHSLSSNLALEILFGRSSETFRELYERGLVLDDFGADYSVGAGAGYGMVGGETPEPDRLRESLLERILRLVEGGISEEDFARSKKAFMGSFIRGFNSLEFIATNSTCLRFLDFELFDSIDLLASLDRGFLQERIRKLLDPANHASFVILPR